MPAYHLIIHGKVQGVFYRQSARHEAVKLGIKGWVRNNEDGTVEAMINGAEDRLQAFISWCGKGPVCANVSGITVTEVAETVFDRFEIRK